MVKVAAAGRHLVSEEYNVVEWSVRVRGRDWRGGSRGECGGADAGGSGRPDRAPVRGDEPAGIHGSSPMSVG
jgi:hypothetical protein